MRTLLPALLVLLLWPPVFHWIMTDSEKQSIPPGAATASGQFNQLYTEINRLRKELNVLHDAINDQSSSKITIPVILSENSSALNEVQHTAEVNETSLVTNPTKTSRISPADSYLDVALAHESEEIDIAWAAEAENLISNTLMADNQLVDKFQQVDCKSSRCRLTLQSISMEEQMSLHQQLTENVSETLKSGIYDSESSPGQLIVYLFNN